MESSTILIRGPRVIDPVRDMDEVADILVRDGIIVATGRISADEVPEGCRIIEAGGLVASPGFIDIHCHLREPGFEYKETIAAGTRAAARGGFTSVCCMPNTEPPIDNAALVDFILRRSQSEAAVRVFPIGCITKVAFSDDGDPLEDSNLMRLALTYSADLGLPITNHCQDRSLSRDGVMAEGSVATRLGLEGIPAAAEEAMMARDISLAELTGGRIHLAHVSTAGSVPLLRQARERGISVTAEVCPHHLTITDQWVLGAHGLENGAAGPDAYDTFTKVYPPLRSQRDVDALVRGLADGISDCIATDHAPHDLASKQATYQEAPSGISVLETALGSAMQLVHQGSLPLVTLVERLTVGPARVMGSSFARLATLEPGTPADIVIFDPDREWVVDPEEFQSMGKNTPLAGTTLKGRVVATLVEGQVVYQDEHSA